MTSPTLRDGLIRVHKYFRVLSDASEHQLEVAGKTARLFALHGVPAVGPVRQRVEFTVAVLCTYGSKYIDGSWAVGEVYFEHAAPADVREHERIFGCAPRFGDSWNGFTFAAELLDRPLRTSDADLCRLLERQAQHNLDESQPLSVADATRALLLRIGLVQDVSLAAVARRIGMLAMSALGGVRIPSPHTCGAGAGAAAGGRTPQAPPRRPLGRGCRPGPGRVLLAPPSARTPQGSHRCG